MKVLFLIRILNCGGAERQLVELARGLHKAGQTVTVAVFYSGGSLERELIEAGVQVRSLGKTGRWDVLRFLYRLASCVRSEKPNVIHGYLILPNLLALFSKLIVPGLRTVWGIRDSDMSLSRYGMVGRMLFKAECLLSRYADLVIANSSAGLEYSIVNGFVRDNIIVIPNGIDTQRFHPDRSLGRLLRTEWRVNESTRLIGIVGRLDHVKDHVTFLRAAANVAQLRNDVRFVCIGEGPDDYRNQLIKLAGDLGLTERLVWAGALSDMRAPYNALDLLVSSSESEGFSNVLGEAMACGIPCVVTDVGDAQWIGGDLVRVVPRKNPNALSAAMTEMVEMISKGLVDADAYRARIVDNFSTSELIDRTLFHLQQIQQPRQLSPWQKSIEES
jgi:glycosyltransferase involved in cell wall biosynthesis